MFTREELEKIGALCREFGAWVFTDEIYEYIVYDGRKHVSIASIPSCRDLAITISGFSKTFSITGWRIGYVVADERVAGPIGLMNDLFCDLRADAAAMGHRPRAGNRRRLLREHGRRLPEETRHARRRAFRGRLHAVDSARRVLHARARSRTSSATTRKPRRRCWKRRASPPFPAPRSSSPRPERGCCASASRRISIRWPKRASGCARSNRL